MIDQRQITEGHVLAIWVGDFETFEQLDAYIVNEFENDFQFRLNDRAMPEISEPSSPAVDIRELLNGFSFSEGWLEDAVRLVEQAGWKIARAAVVFLHLRYRPELCANPNAKLKFVTNVPWNAKD